MMTFIIHARNKIFSSRMIMFLELSGIYDFRITEQHLRNISLRAYAAMHSKLSRDKRLAVYFYNDFLFSFLASTSIPEIVISEK